MGGSAKTPAWGNQDAKQVGKANLATNEQQKFLQQLLSSGGPHGMQALQSLLSGQAPSMGQGQQMFDQSVLQPTMKNYEEQVLPAIESRFGSINAGSSSALNQALAQSSTDLASSLAGQRVNFQQIFGNQQLASQQNQLGALGQLFHLLNVRNFDPIVQGPQKGLMGDLLPVAGQLGSAAILASSIKVKENVRPYEKGLDVVRNLDVRQYDYTIDVDGRKTDRVGLIAEELPSEIQAEINGIQGVDLYGLVSTLVNAVKQLDKKVKELEAR